VTFSPGEMLFVVDCLTESVVLWSASTQGFFPDVDIVLRLASGTLALVVCPSPVHCGGEYLYVLVGGHLGFVRSDLVRRERAR